MLTLGSSLTISSIMLLFITEGYYVGECACEDEKTCDGSSFTSTDIRLCTAYQRAGVTSKATRVSSHELITSNYYG